MIALIFPLLFKSLTGTQAKLSKKHAIRDRSSHPGVKAPPPSFPARAEFLAVKKRAGTIEASLYIYGPDIGGIDRGKVDA